MMTPMFINQMKTGQYFDLNQDHTHQDQLQQVLESSPFYPPSIAASSISSFRLEQGLGMSATHAMDDQSQTFDQLEGSKIVFFNVDSPSYGAQMTSTNNYGSNNHEIFISKQHEDREQNSLNISGDITTNNGASLRWMSSKMRMMRKMVNSKNTKTGPRIISSSINPDHGPQIDISSDTNNDNNGIRVCSDCNTTKTPLWRSGPQGPKTLCNACGIRQRKARKAAMEAAAAAATNTSSCEASSSTSTKTTIKLKINKEKNKSRATSKTCVQHINKKQTTCNKQEANNQLVDMDHNSSSSISNSGKRETVFEEIAVKLLGKNAAFHRMFPQDEEEGALLLMALSYGLIDS